MGQTLTNGIFLPNEGERNCYTGLAGNWRAIDGYIGAYNVHVADAVIHVSQEDRNKWDAVTSKANDADVVHKSGNETVGGEKTFTNDIILQHSNIFGLSRSYICKSQIVVLGDAVNGDSTRFIYLDKNNAEICYIRQRKLTNSNTDMSFCVKNIDNNNNSISAEINFVIDKNNDPRVSPSITNYISLGRSSFRWKDVETFLVNGINPGALFLPVDRGSRVDISAYFTNTGNGGENTYTAPANGYIFLDVTAINKIILFSQTANQQTNYAQTLYGGTDGRIYSFFPIRKNDLFKSTWYTGSAASVTNAFFIPCQGNV